MEGHDPMNPFSPQHPQMSQFGPPLQQPQHLSMAAFQQHPYQQHYQQQQQQLQGPPLQPQPQHRQPIPPPPPPQQRSLSSPQIPPSSSSQSQLEQTDRARAYKSRNKRPCDFCRYKKAACHLESSPPCELCIRYNKECTFVESPAKRRRPNGPNNLTASDIPGSGSSTPIFKADVLPANSVPQQQQMFSGPMGTTMDVQSDMLGWDSGMQQFNVHPLSVSPGAHPDFASYEPTLYHDPTSHIPFETFDHISTTSTADTASNNNALRQNGNQSVPPPPQYRSSIEFSPSSQPTPAPINLNLPFSMTSAEQSLDRQASSNSQIIGFSGEGDPYLMARFRFDQYNEAHFQSIRVRKLVGGEPEGRSIPTFFRISHNGLTSKAQPPPDDNLERFRRELLEMVSDDVGRRLVRLFHRYIQPYFPVLKEEFGNEHDSGGQDLASMPTCILAAIYGHALRFCPWDEELCVDVYTPPSTDALFMLAWHACMPLFHTPSLAVLQTLLLLVQRRPTNKHVSDTPFKATLMATAISIAQALGIDRDPSEWPLPLWEIRLRKRLGWATFVQDKWIALNMGRSSHIQADDWDISPLTELDFGEPGRKHDSKGTPSITHAHYFIKLCELTLILDKIMHDLFSQRATKSLHDRLEATLEVAKPLRLRLTEWSQNLPSGLLPHPSISSSPETTTRPRPVSYDLNGNGSLQLAYITAKIELFRAMLRPRITDSNATAVSALRTGALSVAREIIEFLESLTAKDLEAFWASYSRPNFTIASSFMLLLFVTSPSLPDATEGLSLLNTWRSLLRIQSRSCDLLNLALLRLDGAYVQGMERLIELSPAAGKAWAEQGQQGKGVLQ